MTSDTCIKPQRQTNMASGYTLYSVVARHDCQQYNHMKAQQPYSHVWRARVRRAHALHM